MNRETSSSSAPIRNFWTRRKRIAIAVTATMIIVGLLSLALFYAFRFAMIMEWANKLGDDSQAAKTIIEYLAPSNADKSTALIALFEVIIAIWVGLNIYNFLGKDDLERLEDKEKQLEQLLDKQTGYLTNAVKDASKNSYDVSLATLRNFISLNTAHYATGSYLQEKVEAWQDGDAPEITPGILSNMVNIESFFLSASQANRDGRIPERISIAESGKKECDRLRKSLENTDISAADRKFLVGYIHLRTGDFKFYIGYRIKTGERDIAEAITEYNEAIRSWFPSYLDFGNVSSSTTGELYCLAYLCNVIGECNNVQRQAEMRPDDVRPLSDRCKQLAENALSYFEKAIKIAEVLSNDKGVKLPSYFATYYRNLGTAHDFLDCGSPIEDYTKALKINVGDYLSHQNIAAFHLKKITQPFRPNTVSEIMDNVLPHIDLLVLKCPTYKEGYNLSCWAYTLLANIYLQNKNKKKFQCYMKKAQHFLCLSETFADNNNYGINKKRLGDIEKSAKEVFFSGSSK